MPHGPLLATVNAVNTFAPNPAATDPPETSMTAVSPGSLTLAPRIWEQTNGGSANASDGTQFNNYQTNVGITVHGSGYANGTSYSDVLAVTPTNGWLYNYNFENASGTGWSMSVADGGSWDMTRNGVAETGYTLTEGSNSVSVSPKSGSRFLNVEVTWTGGTFTIDADRWNGKGYKIYLLRASDSAILDNASESFFASGVFQASGGGWASNGNGGYTTAWIGKTLQASGSTGVACKLRLVVFDFGTSQTVSASTDSATFVYSGGLITVYVKGHRVTGSLGTTTKMAISIDEISGGRADYTTANEFISQQIKMNNNWTVTQEAVNKIWYRAEVDFDIPVGVSNSHIPVGHGAKFSLFAKSDATTGTAYAAMTNGPVTLVNGFSTELLNNTQTVTFTGATALATAPYLKFRILMNSGVAAPTDTTNTGTITPVIKAVRIKFFNANANFWWSQEKDLGSAASAYSTFNAASSLSSATANYFMRTGATETALHATAATAITPGTTPANAFGRYIQIFAQIVPTAGDAYASGLPQITGLSLAVLNANESATEPPAAAWVDKRYWLQVTEKNQPFNNRTWCLGANLAWGKFSNVNASCFAVFKDKLLVGQIRAPNGSSNLTVGRIQVVDPTAETDDSTAITWYVKTRDWNGGDLRSPMTLRGVSVLGRALAPQQYPAVGSGFSGFGYTVVPSAWLVDAVTGGQSWTTQAMMLPGTGQEGGYAGFSASYWGRTVGCVIKGNAVNQNAQIDEITLHAWKKEPQER